MQGDKGESSHSELVRERSNLASRREGDQGRGEKEINKINAFHHLEHYTVSLLLKLCVERAQQLW